MIYFPELLHGLCDSLVFSARAMIYFPCRAAPPYAIPRCFIRQRGRSLAEDAVRHLLRGAPLLQAAAPPVAARPTAGVSCGAALQAFLFCFCVPQRPAEPSSPPPPPPPPP
eukprot:SAG11_NODE_25325_length_360_cov_0.869732_1_plen_110_part_10